MNKQEWSLSLKSLVQTQRQHNPIPSRDLLSEEDEWRCRIIGGELIGWAKKYLQNILEQRMVLRIKHFDPNPLIIFTTTLPGLVAAQEIISDTAENFICLLHVDFEEWKKQHTVDEFTFHIHHWSYFCELNDELLTRAKKKYPSVISDELRIHSSGDLWGEHCGAFGDHLWQWNGTDIKLLEERFSQGVY